jgi:hypothetical protein
METLIYYAVVIVGIILFVGWARRFARRYHPADFAPLASRAPARATASAMIRAVSSK